MEFLAYVLRCIFMFLITWIGVHFIGKKSVANMTSYDLAALILITTVASGPIVYRTTSRTVVGVAIITVLSIAVGALSLVEWFNLKTSSPSVLVANGKIIEKELRKAHMNVPLLLSELRVHGYQDLSHVAYAILEPSGKLSVIPASQSRPLQPSDMTMTTSPVRLSFPIIIDGKLKESNLIFLKKDRNWLMDQLNICGVAKIEDVLVAQMDSSGHLYIDLKEKNIPTPQIF